MADSTHFKLDNVLKNIHTGKKFVVTKQLISSVNEKSKNYILVCEKPHYDGDFSYFCTSEICRCQKN